MKHLKLKIDFSNLEESLKPIDYGKNQRVQEPLYTQSSLPKSGTLLKTVNKENFRKLLQPKNLFRKTVIPKSPEQPTNKIMDRSVDKILKRGLISLEPRDFKHNKKGEAVYENQRVLLYIKEQSRDMDRILQGDVEEGNKVHLTHCSTIKQMTKRGFNFRYTPIRRGDGLFPIIHKKTGEQVDVSLRVCENCLTKLKIPKPISEKSKVDKEKLKLFLFDKYLKFGSFPKESLYSEKI